MPSFRRIRHCGILFFFAVLVGGCDKEGSGGSKSPIVSIPPAPVTVSQLVVREEVDHDYYDGRISAVLTVDLRAQVKGYLLRACFKDGDIVKAGDLLFEIDPRPYKAALDQAKAQVASAEANLTLAKAEFARFGHLAAKGVATPEEAETWKSKQGTAAADKMKAQAAVEQAELDLGFTRVVAPIMGKMGRRMVDIGNLVTGSPSDSPLSTIVSIDPIYVYFDVDEHSLLRYRAAGNAALARAEGPMLSVKDLKIPLEIALENDEGYPHTGVIDFADNRVNRSTGTIQVRGVLSNARHQFVDGLRARVRIPGSESGKKVLLTERAVGSEQGRRYVFVVDDKNVVARRDVEVGRAYGRLRAVTGLTGTEKVIVNGILRVREGARVEPHQIPMPDAEPTKSPDR